MRKFTAMIGGTLLGAAAWGASALISGVFEPFDSLPGFLVVQIALSIAAALTGFRAGRGFRVCVGGQLSGVESLFLCDGRCRNPRLGATWCRYHDLPDHHSRPDWRDGRAGAQAVAQRRAVMADAPR